jgi:N-ethylmaleimide reductase
MKFAARSLNLGPQQRMLWKPDSMACRSKPTTDFTGCPLEQLAGDGMFQHFRPLYQGHLIANVDMTQERANHLIEAGLADSIAFGRPYIANPDLPMRFLTAAKLNEVSWPTVYASGPKGYTDYPTLITAG